MQKYCSNENRNKKCVTILLSFILCVLLGDTTVYRSNGEWQILGAPGIRHVIMYLCCPEPYPDVTFYLKVMFDRFREKQYTRGCIYVNMLCFLYAGLITRKPGLEVIRLCPYLRWTHIPTCIFCWTPVHI